MGAGNILPPRGVKIMLNGEERTLRFTVRSLAWLADKHGSVMKVFELFAGVGENLNRVSADVLHGIADLIYAALMHGDPDMTPEAIEDSIDLADITRIMPAVMDAFMQSAGREKKDGDDAGPPKA